MFLLLLLFWIILNGKITAEILLIGIVLAGAIYFFMCKCLEYSPKNDLYVAKNIVWIFAYFAVLVKEIIKSAVTVFKMVYKRRIEIQPQLVYFEADIESEFLRTVLANSITITPGTITVDVDGKSFCVHALDYSIAEGIESSDFIKILKKMEENCRG